MVTLWLGRLHKIEVFRLRLPKAYALLPYQILNEVVCISMISARCPNIPVPKICAFDAKTPNPFVTQEYIDGEPLSTIWNHYTQAEKRLVALKIAEIIVDMAEMRFSGIVGLPIAQTTPLDRPWREVNFSRDE